MKISEVRTRVAQWQGETAPLPPHFCTNPMDLLALPQSSMKTFAFHGWLIVEVEADDGRWDRQRCVGAAGDQEADRSVSEAAADGRRSVGHRISVAAHVSQHDGVWAQGHGDDGHQRGGYCVVGFAGERRRSNLCFDCWADGPRRGFRCMRAGCTARGWNNWRRKRSATRTKDTRR